MRSFARVTVVATITLASLASFDLTVHADQPATYVVVRGDSLTGIASKLGVKTSALLAANSLQITSVILPGQTLVVPVGGRPAASPAAPATTPTGGAGNYTIKPGDSLSAIASRHRVTLRALLAANNMTAASLILPGQVIALPATATPGAAAPAQAPATTPPAAGSGNYTVKKGDSLSIIASRHKVSLRDLLAVNNMTADALILPGQVVALPTGAVSPSTQPTPSTSTPTSTTSAALQSALDYALAQVGKPYQFLGAGPDVFDCSGLTKAAYAKAGVTLVHQSAAQANQGTAVDFRNEPILPGDLVFLATNGTSVINHVGMAIDGSRWVHALRPGDFVRVGSLPAKANIVAVRRYVTSG